MGPDQPVVAATSRSQALQNLAKQLPVANQQVANGLQQAQQTQMQSAIQQAGPTSNTGAAAQQLGAQSQQAQGGIALNQAQQTQNQLQSVAQSGLSEQSRQQRLVAGQQQIEENSIQRQLGQKLSGLDRQAKKQILDDNMQFRLDESGRALLNERQLADWAIQNATSDQDYQSKMQAADQMWQRKEQVLQTANARILQMLQQGYDQNKQQLDETSRKDLMLKQNALKAEIARNQAKKQSSMQQWQAGGTILGTGLAAGLAVATGGASLPFSGAIVGATGALGTLAGNQVNQQQPQATQPTPQGF